MENNTKDLKYKIIFSDLDNTLLVNNEIPDFNLEAIQKARKLGVKFIICTGRDLDITFHLLKQLNTDNLENEYTICCSGAKIYENKTKKTIHINYLPNDIVKELFDYGKQFTEIVLLFDTSNGIYVYNSKILAKEAERVKMIYTDIKTFEEIQDFKIIRVVYGGESGEYVNKIQDEIKKSKIFDNRVDFYLTQNQFLEFNASGVNKGEALKWLCNYLNINLNETIAIGDSYNDVSMLKVAGIGACVKSAEDEIKKISKYVCEKDYFEGSVKEVIEKFVLN